MNVQHFIGNGADLKISSNISAQGCHPSTQQLVDKQDLDGGQEIIDATDILKQIGAKPSDL